MLIHCPNFVKTILIALFKSLKLVLELLELLCELLVIISKFEVFSLILFALSFKLFFDSS